MLGPGAPAEELDVAEAAHVAWICGQRDSSLWHAAAMAALAYRGDRHGLLLWLLAQPELDRATAGWLWLWPEGSRYLRGAREFHLNHVSSEAMIGIFVAIAARSGFTHDEIGLDADFEVERQAASRWCARAASRRASPCRTRSSTGRFRAHGGRIGSSSMTG